MRLCRLVPGLNIFLFKLYRLIKLYFIYIFNSLQKQKQKTNFLCRKKNSNNINDVNIEMC